MTVDEVLDRMLEMLQRRGRVSYRALKRQFDLDGAYVEDLKAEIIEVHQLAADQDGKQKRFSPLAPPWKANASRARCCSPTSRARPS
jgi:hypothetical protein